MNSIKKLIKNIEENLAEYYTLLTIIFALPFAISLLTNFKWGLLVSFMMQAIIGIMYIRGENANTK